MSGVHVIRDADHWWVVREGGEGIATSPVVGLREAVRIGKTIASAEHTELTVYDEQGRVRGWRDFPSEPDGACHSTSKSDSRQRRDAAPGRARGRSK